MTVCSLGPALDRRIDREVRGQERDPDEQDGEEDGHDHERRRGVLRFGRLERGHAGGDRLGAGQRDGAGCEGAQQQEDADRTGRVCRGLRRPPGGGARVLAEDEDPVRPDGDHQQRAAEEEVRRDREDVAGLAQAAQVADRDERDAPRRRSRRDTAPSAGTAETICSTADEVETATVRL